MNRMKENIVLSIVIVNYETPDYTIACTRSLLESGPRCSLEIIVIDNGSKDGSLSLIRQAFPDVICIETGENLGFARANNLGINNARGEYVLILNSDTKVLGGCLDRLFETLMTDPSLGAVAPKQLDGRGKLQLSWGSFPTFLTEIYRKIVHYRLSLNDFIIRDYLEEKYAGQINVDWISGSCLMARKKALEDAGLFDPHYFMYFEDIDLCRKIRDAGWKIRLDTDASIIHYGGVSAKKNILHVMVEYRHSQIYFTRKYYGLRGGAGPQSAAFCQIRDVSGAVARRLSVRPVFTARRSGQLRKNIIVQEDPGARVQAGKSGCGPLIA